MVTTTWTQAAGMSGDTDTDNIENYAEQAEASKDAAAASETAAAASATAAAASEADAATDAASALSSKNAAAVSEANSATSEANSASSAASASTSATNASTSASNSATSAAASASSAAAASASEANSATSSAAALVSENAAAASETAASASASAASTSEANASASETAASASETAAQTAQAAAEAAEAATEALFDQFGDQYLGPKASDPTVDNDGNPLAEGAVYFNTTDDVLKFYSGSAWVAPESVATTAAAAAQAAQAAAETAETNAETAETNAAASASSASSSASAASTSASEAAASAASINLSSIDIDGGTIDGTVIGGSTPAAGSFTTGSFTGDVAHGDNVKATFGASADLQVFHDGANSRIVNSTGSVLVRNDDLYIQSSDGATNAARFNETTGVTLFRAGATKLTTTSTGINVTGSIIADEELAIVSASGYGRIEVGGPSGAFIDLKSPNSDDYDGRIATYGFGLYIGTPPSSGSPVALQFEQTTKLATTSTGIDVTGDVVADGLTVDGDATVQGASGATLTLKSTSTSLTTNDLLGQVDFYNNDFSGDGPSVQARISATTPNTIGNGSVLQFFTTNAGTGTEGSDPISRMQINHLGDVSFYEDTGSQAKLTWDASDEALEFGDNVKATFGASADLRIYQNGSDSIIEDQGAGNLVIRGTDLYIRSSSNSNRIYAGTDTRLYYDGNEKIRTTNTGVSVTGSIDFGDWTITESGGSLYFATGGTNKMKLDASGNLDVVGSVNSNATIS